MALAIDVPRTGRATDLISLALALGARTVPGWSAAEEGLVAAAPPPLPLFLSDVRAGILQGRDPLGDAYCRRFSADERRPLGATYTPTPIVEAMLGWAADQLTPQRIVDPGAGSARFLVAAGRLFPDADLIAVEVDPLATILARGHLAAAGLGHRAQVILQDYRQLRLPAIDGPTLYIGNPPYVRHHQIEPSWKQWLTETARRRGHNASQLAGLHVYFFLATAEQARAGDVGTFITAAEWLDVKYGRLVRDLLLGVLGMEELHVIEPTADPFPGTQATAVISGFKIGAKPKTIGLRRVASVQELGTVKADWRVRREQLAAADRWTPLTRLRAQRREGFVELGELCRVHRGQVTGANTIWITDDNPFALPANVLFPSITRARELFATDGVLTDASKLRRVIDLPAELSGFDAAARRRIDAFLAYAQSRGANDGYIARHRRPWWSVGLRQPAPILATYMARRPPVFVRNLVKARHINIAHGLYPRVHLSDQQLCNLATYLSSNVNLADGRTYAGGLTKFEPREMERLLIPEPALLHQAAILEALL